MNQELEKELEVAGSQLKNAEYDFNKAKQHYYSVLDKFNMHAMKRRYHFVTGIQLPETEYEITSLEGEGDKYAVTTKEGCIPNTIEGLGKVTIWNGVFRDLFAGQQLVDAVAAMEQFLTVQNGRPYKFE